MTVAIALGLTILEFILLSPRAGFAQNTDMANNVEGEQLNSEYKFIWGRLSKAVIARQSVSAL